MPVAPTVPYRPCSSILWTGPDVRLEVRLYPQVPPNAVIMPTLSSFNTAKSTTLLLAKHQDRCLHTKVWAPGVTAPDIDTAPRFWLMMLALSIMLVCLLHVILWSLFWSFKSDPFHNKRQPCKAWNFIIIVMIQIARRRFIGIWQWLRSYGYGRLGRGICHLIFDNEAFHFVLRHYLYLMTCISILNLSLVSVVISFSLSETLIYALIHHPPFFGHISD